jgi:hypothetical protein
MDLQNGIVTFTTKVTCFLDCSPFEDCLCVHHQERMYVCMYKGWAIKLALAPRPLKIYCASLLAAAMIITVAALRIVLAHGSKPT